jgi:hypothetical protein
LTLGAAAVLHRTAAELFAQRVEERDPVVDGDLFAVEEERDARQSVRRGLDRVGGAFGGGVAQRAGCAEAPRLS